jgi:hypothetical protein
MSINNKLDFSDIILNLQTNKLNTTKTARMELFQDNYNEMVSTCGLMIFGNDIVKTEDYKKCDSISEETQFKILCRLENDYVYTPNDFRLWVNEKCRTYDIDTENVINFLINLSEENIITQIKTFPNEYIMFDMLLQDNKGFMGNIALFRINKTIKEEVGKNPSIFLKIEKSYPAYLDYIDHTIASSKQGEYLILLRQEKTY